MDPAELKYQADLAFRFDEHKYIHLPRDEFFLRPCANARREFGYVYVVLAEVFRKLTGEHVNTGFVQALWPPETLKHRFIPPRYPTKEYLEQTCSVPDKVSEFHRLEDNASFVCVWVKYQAEGERRVCVSVEPAYSARANQPWFMSTVTVYDYGMSYWIHDDDLSLTDKPFFTKMFVFSTQMCTVRVTPLMLTDGGEWVPAAFTSTEYFLGVN